jgi:hypothetical protein
MALAPRQARDWIDATFAGVLFAFGIAMICVGAFVLLDATVVLLLFLVYQWLRYGVWYSYSLASVLSWADVPDDPSQLVTWLGVRKVLAWCVEAPLLSVMPTVGGAMALVGLIICVVAFGRGRAM